MKKKLLCQNLNFWKLSYGGKFGCLLAKLKCLVDDDKIEIMMRLSLLYMLFQLKSTHVKEKYSL